MFLFDFFKRKWLGRKFKKQFELQRKLDGEMPSELQKQKEHEKEILELKSQEATREEARIAEEQRKELLRKLKLKVISFLDIDDKFKDKHFCLDAVRINGHILKFIPQNVLDLEICIAAVENNNNAIHHVPIKYKAEVFKICKIPQITSPILKCDDASDAEIKDLMEEYIPGIPKSYGIHDGGSLYDQSEYIKDHL